MSPDEVRDAFRAFAGEEKFRKFVRTLNAPDGGRSRYWQEHLWTAFVNTLPVPDCPLESVRDAFRFCPDHGCDLRPGPEPFRYDTSATITVPGGVMWAWAYAEAHRPLALRETLYCSQCRTDLTEGVARGLAAARSHRRWRVVRGVWPATAAAVTGAAGFAAGLLAGWLLVLGYAHYLMWLHHGSTGDVYRVIRTSTATLAVVFVAGGAAGRAKAVAPSHPALVVLGGLLLALWGACMGFTGGVVHANWAYDEPWWVGGGYGFYGGDPTRPDSHPGSLGIWAEATESVAAKVAFVCGFGGLLVPLAAGWELASAVGRKAWDAPARALWTWLPLGLVAAAVLFFCVGVAGSAWADQHVRLQTRLEASMQSVLAQRDALLVGAAVEGAVAPGMAAGGYVEGLRRLEAGEVRNCPHRFRRAFRDHLTASADLDATVGVSLRNPMAAVRVLVEKGGGGGAADSVKRAVDTALRTENGMRMELAQVTRRLDQLTGRAGP